ncbi:MAG TPA: hypothetical protein VGW76_00580 [Pyrinomonadaceae bacterium]|nr:hypothetical protein [Pyrinomonadaceae bacterium]
MSEIFCGRGSTDNFCEGGGVTVLVAVVLALSIAAEHELSNTTIIETQNDDKAILRF